MHISCKPLASILSLAFYVSSLPFIDCSILHEEVTQFEIDTRKSLNSKTYQVSPQKTPDIALHGFILWASMGFLMPLGILIIRMSSREEVGSVKSSVFFYLHVAFQTLSVLLAIVGAAMSLEKFENSFNNSHQRLGLALYGAILVQALIGFFRPHRGKKERSYWYFVHWMLGTIVSLAGIINIYTGLKAYHQRTLKSTRLLTILFTAQVSFMALIYLFQDKLDYMKKQGVTPTSESVESSHQDIAERQNQKEPLTVVECGKRNALGNLFD